MKRKAILRQYRALAPGSTRRKTRGSDGLFLVLAIGAVLLASLLAPRTPFPQVVPETSSSQLSLSIR